MNKIILSKINYSFFTDFILIYNWKTKIKKNKKTIMKLKIRTYGSCINKYPPILENIAPTYNISICEEKIL